MKMYKCKPVFFMILFIGCSANKEASYYDMSIKPVAKSHSVINIITPKKRVYVKEHKDFVDGDIIKMYIADSKCYAIMPPIKKQGSQIMETSQTKTQKFIIKFFPEIMIKGSSAKRQMVGQLYNNLLQLLGRISQDIKVKKFSDKISGSASCYV